MLGRVIRKSYFPVMNFKKGEFSTDFFGWLTTFFQSNPDVHEDDIARFRTEILDEINPM
jgi:hypothetical protein